MNPEGGALTQFLPPIVATASRQTLQERAAVASTFVAGLELAREGSVHLDQEVAGEAIVVRAVREERTVEA